jgi:hypothetical protein
LTIYDGADTRSVADVYQNRFLEDWQEITRIRKPIIAAVSGYAVNTTAPRSSSFNPVRADHTNVIVSPPFLPCSSVEAASSP